MRILLRRLVSAAGVIVLLVGCSSPEPQVDVGPPLVRFLGAHFQGSHMLVAASLFNWTGQVSKSGERLYAVRHTIWLRSRDGEHWKAVGVMPGYPYSVNEVIPGEILVTTNAGVQHSGDGGATWDRVMKSKLVTSIVWDGVHRELMACEVRNGIVRHVRNRFWTRINSVPPEPIYQVAGGDSLLYLLTRRNDSSLVYRSRDGAFTWDTIWPYARRIHFLFVPASGELMAATSAGLYRFDGSRWYGLGPPENTVYGASLPGRGLGAPGVAFAVTTAGYISPRLFWRETKRFLFRDLTAGSFTEKYGILRNDGTGWRMALAGPYTFVQVSRAGKAVAYGGRKVAVSSDTGRTWREVSADLMPLVTEADSVMTGKNILP